MSSIKKTFFGETREGKPCCLLDLKNNSGTNVVLTEYGATIVEINCKDRNNKIDNICLRYPTLSDYENESFYLGSAIGRFANRIGGAEYSFENQKVYLKPNENGHTLHGGESSFADKIWNIELFSVKAGVPTLVLSSISSTGEGGFPGRLETVIKYQLFDNDCFRISIKATSDAVTPVSITYHPYFNLSQQLGLDHHLFSIFAERVTEVDSQSIPTGKLLPVEGTVLDFRQDRSLSEDLLNTDQFELLKSAEGFDYNYCFEPWSKDRPILRHLSKVQEIKNGRVLDLFSTLPGLQFYTGNGLKAPFFQKHQAFCLEPQFYPDSPNHPNFPFSWTSKTAPYQHVMEWKMGVVP